MKRSFKAAPLDREIKFMTVGGLVVMGGAAWVLFNAIQSSRISIALKIFFIIDEFVLLGLLIRALFSIIRRYEISSKSIVVVRLFGQKEIPIESATSIETNADLMKDAVRLFGIGGFFSISGLFQSSRFGKFHAYVTSPKKLVGIKSASGNFVISPENPDKFVNHLRSRINGVSI